MVCDLDFTLLGDGLDRHRWSEKNGEDFYICKILKMTSVDIDDCRSARIWMSELRY